ncbi:MAG: tRNA (adenosine(37)-N6)-threonylcarbamoyltransferase complex ATPase subunit type 1 TsaE [Hyphomicrobiaceae bacterium]
MPETTYSFERPNLDERAMRHLADLFAATARPGDMIALEGDLGAGKTTFARALIRSITANPHEEIPSPTFTLVQTYATPRMPVAHFDLYRLADPDELIELGLDEVLASGIALVEWPERGGDLLPRHRMTLAIADAADGNPDHRDVTLSGSGTFAARIERLQTILHLLDTTPWGEAGTRITYLQGDASARRYMRVTQYKPSAPTKPAILMDWPRQPDGPPIRNGLPYSRIAHLAEDVRPFVAIADALRRGGIATPEIWAADLDTGILLIEDFGDRVFGHELGSGTDQAMLWDAALDVLMHMRTLRADLPLPVNGAEPWMLPRYDRNAMAIEVELLADWLWRFATGGEMPGKLRAEFTNLWNSLIDELQALPTGWVLRDFHSPNLIWRPDRTGLARVGVIDFQDAIQGPLAFDVVSLLQDARVDVPADLETTLIDRYCAQARDAEPGFDENQFRFAYAALGAQRNTKILGIFARLARRDGKPQYVAHLPRIWGYLTRCLEHPQLAALKSFYDAYVFTLVRTTA